MMLLLSLVASLALAQPHVRIDDAIMAEAVSNGQARVLLRMKERPDLSLFKSLDASSRGWAVYKSLKEAAELSQAPLVATLKEFGIPFRSYWISNVVAVSLDARMLSVVSAVPGLESIVSNAPFKVALEEPEEDHGVGAADRLEWNVAWINADEVWAMGYNGNGSVYANADTGIQHTHPEIADNYRGAPNNNHNFNWWDGVKEAQLPGGGTCGIDSQTPCDDNGHGTHTTGTSVGTLGCGVAPGATWIGCRNMDRGYGSPESYISCLQFFMAPHDLNGNGANPDLRPDAIGNSYGCPASEGCNANSLRDACDALRAVGVFMSVSAGNAGSQCSTVADTPATTASVISVGATGFQTNTIASYSSRGPIAGGSAAGTRAPTLVSPGSSVRSAVPTNRYASYSGTSMASPHVGAAVAVIAQACPWMRYDVDSMQSLLEETALPLTSTQLCGGDAPGAVPNNVYGYGQLDLAQAVRTCLARKH
eukprot:TRINITY_DN924_c0_g1_i1.p1 TRINITY_DN924_c0_g1~~TRINITY_DN924_c0_g1_i1.p1  ORF type:complete len:479 (-),score=77.75 TRINITY_DN924_c0_g1_i1:33-1469(-)